MKELIARLSLPSPEFFVKLKKFGGFLTGLSVILMGLQSQFPSVGIPPVVSTVAGYLAVAGSVIMGVSQLTVEDRSELQHKVGE